MTEGTERRRYRPRQNTQGVKGARLPRINMAFDPDVYGFIREAAGRENMTMTRLVNETIRDRMKETSDHDTETAQ